MVITRLKLLFISMESTISDGEIRPSTFVSKYGIHFCTTIYANMTISIDLNLDRITNEINKVFIYNDSDIFVLISDNFKRHQVRIPVEVVHPFLEFNNITIDIFYHRYTTFISTRIHGYSIDRRKAHTKIVRSLPIYSKKNHMSFTLPCILT